MVWEPSNQNGGFSLGKSWLPVASEHLGRAVARQEQDEAALLHHYRKAVALRQSTPVLASGAHSEMRAEGDVVRFMRHSDGTEVFCAFNLSDAPASVQAPAHGWQTLGTSLGAVVPDAGGRVTLEPWQACLAIRKKS